VNSYVHCIFYRKNVIIRRLMKKGPIAEIRWGPTGEILGFLVAAYPPCLLFSIWQYSERNYNIAICRPVKLGLKSELISVKLEIILIAKAYLGLILGKYVFRPPQRSALTPIIKKLQNRIFNNIV